MGYKTITLKLPTDYSNDFLRSKISKELRIKEFDFEMESKSLDARKKSNIFWLVKVVVNSSEIKNGEQEPIDELKIPFKNRPYSKRTTKSFQAQNRQFYGALNL